ncbi:MAG: hypothetical protein OK456_00260 [Thaumarchaeota archaeon]|nr:hypothetical protein [Nitrososphaerota archaeon]
MSGRLALVSLIILTGFVVASVLIAWFNPFSFSYFYAGARFANISGFLALFLIAGTGIMMVFRKPLLRFSKNPEGLRQLHVIVSALGGFFLIVHVAFFLLFPVTLPVLFGYLGTYAAFAIWVTGVIFIEGFRSSLFYHSLLSVIGVALILIHVFGAGRDIPTLVSGVALVAIASVVLVGALKEQAGFPPERGPRKAGV